MPRFAAAFLLVLTGIAQPMRSESAELSDYLKDRTAELEKISPERRERLDEIARYLRSQRDSHIPIRLTFICTHNSRRSQLAQVWVTIAAVHYGVGDLEAFSGGTEVTELFTLKRSNWERFTDKGGTFSLDVKNVAPTASVTGPTAGVRYLSRTFTLSATDPSTVDTARRQLPFDRAKPVLLLGRT